MLLTESIIILNSSLLTPNSSLIFNFSRCHFSVYLI